LKNVTIGIKGILEVIEILYDHSYVDDYYMISSIEVMIEDQAEKERISKAIQDNGLLRELGFPDADYIASILKVNRSLIVMDTNEIDLM